jgi:hypothetical protein
MLAVLYSRPTTTMFVFSARQKPSVCKGPVSKHVLTINILFLKLNIQSLSFSHLLPVFSTCFSLFSTDCSMRSTKCMLDSDELQLRWKKEETEPLDDYPGQRKRREHFHVFMAIKLLMVNSYVRSVQQILIARNTLQMLTADIIIPVSNFLVQGFFLCLSFISVNNDRHLQRTALVK